MRRDLLFAAALMLAATAQPGGRKVILDGVEPYRVVDPLFECVRIAVNHRGETYSPAYIQGIAGAAFRIGGPSTAETAASRSLGPRN